jgi:hypothetical protein
METPFFGPFDVTRSTNLADNQLINLRPELVDTKDGKNIGALFGTPGLDLLTTVGLGPINGLRTLGGSVLYAVSGTSVYTVSSAWSGSLVGSLVGNGGRVSIIDNNTQIAFFTDLSGFVGPAGQQFVSGGIQAGGTNYAANDTVVMAAVGGTQTAALIIKILTLSGSTVTGFQVLQGGAFNPLPATLVQQSTTGSGSGLIINAPVFSGTNSLCRIYLPFPPPGDGLTMYATYQDGFGLLPQPGTTNIWQSQVLDISVWPALNFATADGESGFVQVLADIHRELFVFKQKNTEVWNDAGTAGFAFQPLGAVMIEHGTVAPATVVKVGDTLIWLSQSSEGIGLVLQNEGISGVKKVSTHAIDTLIAAVPNITNAFAYSYQQEGHQLYVLTLPAGNLTLVYDATDSLAAGVPIWYQWLSFSNGQFARHWGNAFANYNQTLVLGDYRNGNLYRINLDTLTDNGTPRKWLRSWRARQKPSPVPERFASLQIDMQTGVGLLIANPQVVLDWSDDGGWNWSNPRIISAGQLGQTAWRVRATRLGSTRRNSGLDRIFRLSSTDPFPVCLIGADLDV